MECVIQAYFVHVFTAACHYCQGSGRRTQLQSDCLNCPVKMWLLTIYFELFILWLHSVHQQYQYSLKLQAAMEGTSPGSPPTGGFRKTGNSEQYAFKKVSRHRAGD